MKPIFHPDAEREFQDGIRKYLQIDAELAADFEAKVEEAVAIAGYWRKRMKDSPVNSRRTNRRKRS